MHHTIDYSRQDLVSSLRAVGLREGDVVFSHSNIGYFGRIEGDMTAEHAYKTIRGAFFDVIGPEGTLCVPTFTYSFCRGQSYEPDKTPSTCGLFTELFRRDDRSLRTHDPIFSVAAQGARAGALLGDLDVACFGSNSFWNRFMDVDGVVCNMNFDAGSTFIHYVERCLNVGYRYDKLFSGDVRDRGSSRRTSCIFFCRDSSTPMSVPAFEAFHHLAMSQDVARQQLVGRGFITAIRARDTFDLIANTLPTRPSLLTKGDGAEGVLPPALLGSNVANREIPDTTTPAMLLQLLVSLPRDTVSEGCDEALAVISSKLPMHVHSCATGDHLWSWIVPEKWMLKEVVVKTLDGKPAFVEGESTMRASSYSQAFQGEVTRSELLEHLHVHPGHPEAIPNRFAYYRREWSLCCSARQKAALTDNRYRVAIDAEFGRGELKVGEAVVAGREEETILIYAHWGHTGSVHHGLSGVVAGLEVVRRLKQRTMPRYTYRLVVGPELFGAVAWLSKHEASLGGIVGGLFLNMLARPHAHCLQRSAGGDALIDRCAQLALRACDDKAWTASCGSTVPGDEAHFNAPGVMIPMASLTRALPSDHPDAPFPGYRSSLDDIRLADEAALTDSINVVMTIVEYLERNIAPQRKYPGMLFGPRCGYALDIFTPEPADALPGLVYAKSDGIRTLVDIAFELNQSFEDVEACARSLREHGLVEARALGRACGSHPAMMDGNHE